MGAGDTNIIDASGLRKTYRSDESEVHALDGIDIKVCPGEFVAIMGPSGSGKSTLLHVLGGLDVADGGDVVLNGVSLAALSPSELALVRRRQVGFVFQFFNLVAVLTVEENARLPAQLDGTDARERLEEILGRLGLTEQRSKLPSKLSGGEQQRVAIARALVNRPAVILADEPTGNLDRANGTNVMSLLHDLNADGQTIVLATHDPLVASYARRAVFLRDGRIVDDVPLDSDRDPAAVLARLAALEM